MKKLKVIQIIDSLNVGGAEVLAVNIANGLLEQGAESYLCATRKEGDLKENLHSKVGYIYLNKKSTFDLKAILKLKRYIKKNKIDIIHAHSTSSFIAYVIKLLIPKVKLIWHNHSGAYTHLFGKKLKALKIISKKFDYIISVNLALEFWAKKTLKHNEGSYLSNFPNFTNLKKQTTLLGEKNKKIVCLAGFREEKDHINLLKAFKLVKEKKPDWTLHLIGKDYKDAYSKEVKDFLKKEKLSQNVFLYGVCSDIQYILNQATIGVLSSKSEGLPVSLLEYGLAKLPVLVTDVGECKNVVKNKNALVAPNRSDKFATKLLKMIIDKEIRNQISEELHKNVAQNFSKESIIKQLISIYKK